MAEPLNLLSPTILRGVWRGPAGGDNGSAVAFLRAKCNSFAIVCCGRDCSPHEIIVGLSKLNGSAVCQLRGIWNMPALKARGAGGGLVGHRKRPFRGAQPWYHTRTALNPPMREPAPEPQGEWGHASGFPRLTLLHRYAAPMRGRGIAS